jgi:hypothetical protein
MSFLCYAGWRLGWSASSGACGYIICSQPPRQHLCLSQDAGVRQAAATALLALYNADDNVSPLHAFTARFSTRFAELVYDVDEGVAVKGVRQSHAHALETLESPDKCNTVS